MTYLGASTQIYAHNNALPMLTDAAHFTDLIDYTDWANRLILDAIAELDSTSAARDEALRLMSHTLRAQAVWLGRVLHTDAAKLAIWETDALEACRERNEATIQAWRTHLVTCSADDLSSEIHYTTSNGTPYTSTLRQIATHVVNHGTHHRAQISRILREAGHTPPGTDYIFYCRVRDGG